MPRLRPHLEGAGRRPLADDRPHRRRYTNIATVKLFAHAEREDGYARDAMHEFMAPCTGRCALVTLLTSVAQRAQRAAAVLGSRACRSGCGRSSAVSVGAIAARHRPRAAPARHVALDHVGDGRPVREHRHRAGRHRHDRRASAPSSTRRTPSRSSCRAARSASSTSASTTASERHGARRLIDDLSLHDHAGREGRPGRPLRRRQVDARQPAAALLRPRGRPHPDRRPGHRRTSRRTACARRSAW